MKTNLHLADNRGEAELDWLSSQHTYSFGSFYAANRMGFGKLRVINDDVVQASKGFATHSHQNMEIISIPLSGTLAHKDSMENSSTIKTGDVQIMSAGIGVTHSEYNPSNTDSVNFLQIWILPEQTDIEPRYQQKHFPPAQRQNQQQLIISPDSRHGSIKINQKAYFSLLDTTIEKRHHYVSFMEGSGVYLFMIKGEARLKGIKLHQRDGIEITDIDQFDICVKADSQLLFIEVPLN